MSNQLDLAPKDETQAAPKRRLRWSFLLATFMRCVALAWFIKGASWWAEMFGFDPAVNFEAKRNAAKAVAIGFGILDLVAAVGLWLLAAWGGVMWLLAVTTEIVLTFMAPRVFSVTATRIAVLVALIVAYLIFASFAARETTEE